MAYFVCHIVHHDDAVCAAVVRAGNGSEALLPCGIPLLLGDTGGKDVNARRQTPATRSHPSTHNLQLDGLVPHFNCPETLPTAANQHRHAPIHPVRRYSHKEQPNGSPTYEIHADGADVAFSECVILQNTHTHPHPRR